MRAYAERHADSWFILSAEHGLLQPDQVIAPYEKTLNAMPKEERRNWARRVGHALLANLQPGTSVLMLAGKRYREELAPLLHANGFKVEVPMQGLKLGHQLRWLKAQASHG